MDEFISAPPETLVARVQQPALRHLLSDWSARCRPGKLPGRADFGPEGLRYILGNLILWNIAGDPWQATCRLFGSNLMFQRGFDLTGKTPDDHPDPMMRDLTRLGIDRLIATRQPLLTRGHHPLQDGSILLIETVSLPLAADGQHIDMVIHGQFNRLLTSDDAAAQAPRVETACAPVAALLPDIRDARLRRVAGDWERWRGARRLPARGDFTPEVLHYLLGNLFLFDIVPAGAGTSGAAPRFRYRLFGSNVAAYRGFDLTGRHIDEHPDAAFAARAQQAYAQAAAAALPFWALVDGISPDGMIARFEALILPLASDGMTPDMVLAAQVLDGPLA